MLVDDDTINCPVDTHHIITVRLSPHPNSLPRPQPYILEMALSAPTLRLRSLLPSSIILKPRPTRRLTSPSTSTAQPSHLPLSPLASQLHSLRDPPSTFFLLGGPGSGKGTLSSFIVSRLRHHHVSVGALLRDASKHPTPEARQILTAIQAGNFVPAATSTKLLLSHLANLTGPCVVDGFPRTLDNAHTWENLGLSPKRVVALEVDEQTMRDRLMARGRHDDIPEVAERRLGEFWVEWDLIKEFYRTRGLLTIIDGQGSPEQVWQSFEEKCSKDWVL